MLTSAFEIKRIIAETVINVLMRLGRRDLKKITEI